MVIEAIKDAARGRWVYVLGSMGVDTSRLRPVHGPCPGCGGRDRFRFDDRDGNGTWICGGGGGEPLAGDGIALLMHVRGWNCKTAVRELAQFLGVSQEGAKPKRRRRRRKGENRPRPAPQREPPPASVDMERVDRICRGMPAIDRDWVRARSPVDVSAAGPREFFEALYRWDEKILVSLSVWSPGDFLWWVGHGSYRLGRQEGEQAAPAPMPRGGLGGVLMLANPVDGRWHETTGGRRNRRCAAAVTSWRYVVLESDVLSKGRWLQVVCQAPLRIAAVFTTGNRSVHALVRVDAAGRDEWIERVRTLAALFGPLGGDVSAVGGLPMSRYPFALRYGDLVRDETGAIRHQPYPHPKRQALWYCNPRPEPKPLIEL